MPTSWTSAASRCPTPSTRSPAACRATWNVLLAEADVPLRAAARDGGHQPGSCRDADKAVVVGAEPTSSPPRRKAPHHRFLIIEAQRAQQVIVIKRSPQPRLRRHRQRSLLRTQHVDALLARERCSPRSPPRSRTCSRRPRIAPLPGSHSSVPGSHSPRAPLPALSNAGVLAHDTWSLLRQGGDNGRAMNSPRPPYGWSIR